jgi:CBS domain-containing protein/anti-sigma regulatory factor (Ser/Thr protein kinase)
LSEEIRVTKIQGLLYELTASEVMNRNVVTVPSNATMSEVRELFRLHRISGAPVVKGETLAGMISIEDLIAWLTERGPDCPVTERMTEDVKTSFPNESLVSVMEKFDRYRFGRFPVIRRKDRNVVGILTKGTVIEGLLKKLAAARRDEEERLYSKRSFFEDIIADESSLTLKYNIAEQDLEHAGRIAGCLRKTLRYLNVHPRVVRRSAVATYEAEMNTNIYATSGEIRVNVDPYRIRINVTDRGPGISDIEKAMQPGYSTAPQWIREMGFGAGMGLSNIRKCSDEMDLTSTVGEGTHLKISINM